MKYVFPEYKENVVLGNGKLQLNPMSYQVIYEGNEYSCAMKSHFRKFGNQMSGSGNHLCNYVSLLA